MEDRVYHIRYLPEDAPEPFAEETVFDPALIPESWMKLEEAKLDQFPWERDYRPSACARMGWNAKGLHILMYADEPSVRCEIRETGGDVYTDSCLECFIAPKAGDPRYINCEVNPLGTLHMGVGASRYDRVVERTVPEGMAIRHSQHNGGWWAVAYCVPAAFLKARFDIVPSEMRVTRGNFYKCGNAHTLHHGMYKPYDLEAPDFHRPELFARFELE